jgi:hypothetical protein
VNKVPHPASAEGNDIDRALSNLRNAISSAMSAIVDAMDVPTDGFSGAIAWDKLVGDDVMVIPIAIAFLFS